MRSARPACAIDPRRFGRRVAVTAMAARWSGLSDDLRLFAVTYAGGFLFVSILLA